MFRPGGWSVRIALFILEWQCAMSNRWWCVQSPLIPRLGETLWCGGTWKQRAAARDPKWSLTIIRYYRPGAGGGGGGGTDRDPGRAAAGPGRRGVCWGPSGWSLHPCPHNILDFRIPQSADRAVFHGENAAFRFFFFSTQLLMWADIFSFRAEGARCRGPSQSSAYLRRPRVSPLMSACMGKCFV